MDALLRKQQRNSNSLLHDLRKKHIDWSCPGAFGNAFLGNVLDFVKDLFRDAWHMTVVDILPCALGNALLGGGAGRGGPKITSWTSFTVHGTLRHIDSTSMDACTDGPAATPSPALPRSTCSGRLGKTRFEPHAISSSANMEGRGATTTHADVEYRKV